MGRTHRWSNRLHGADHRAADDVHPVRAFGTYILIVQSTLSC